MKLLFCTFLYFDNINLTCRTPARTWTGVKLRLASRTDSRTVELIGNKARTAWKL